MNKVILIGYLGGDPELRYTAGGSAVANFTVATSKRWKDKQSGQTQERTEWHRIVMFNRLAEVAGEYLKKGSRACIEGEMQTRKWTDKHGTERQTTEVVCSSMEMLSSSQDNKNAPQNRNEYAHQSGRYNGPRGQQPQPPAQQHDNGYQGQPEQGDPGYHDDEIPF